MNPITGMPAGGACISACASNADCTSNAAWLADTLCDTTTGYCVPCLADSDCTAGADPSLPTVTPVCVPFPDAGLVTGGGRCGCSDTSQCNGGYACLDAGNGSTCQPPCTFANGVDSCRPFQTYLYSCSLPLAYCNTYTGACQQCLDDYDCTDPWCNQPYCSNGTCLQCRSGDDCGTAFPDNSCVANSCLSSCTDRSQCPTDGGYDCIQAPPDGGSNCLVTCVMGDDAGLGTVSDAGNPCPQPSPFCVFNPYAAGASHGVCAQCLGPNDTTSCQPQGISCGIFMEVDTCIGLTCVATCQ
jgi:hypothetical protein